MAIKSDSFVDKVYDAYISSDYSYGDDNLNPKHEINKSTYEDTFDTVEKILEKVKAKAREISEKYADTSFEMPTIEANFGGGGKNPEMPTSLKMALSRSGTRTKNIMHIPSMEDDPDALTFQIEAVMSKIIMTINSDSMGSTGGGGESSNPDVDGLSLFEVDCNGTLNPITGKVVEKEKDGSSADIASKPNDNNNDGDNNGGGSGSDISDDSTNSKDDSSESQQEDAVNDAMTQAANDINDYNANAKACAIADLKLLKGLLSILKVVRGIKSVIDPVLGITMEIVQIVVLAAQAWNNPTTIGEILSRITQKIMAILMQIMAMLLQMMWDMLGLDCTSAQVKSVVDEIRATLAGIDSLFQEVNKTAISMGNQVKQLKDAFEEAQSAIQEALEGSDLDSMRKKLGLTKEDLLKSAQNIYNDNFTSDALLKNVKGSIESTDAYSKVMSNVNGIKRLQEEATATIDKILKQKEADSDVRKMASQFSDLLCV